MAQRETKQQKAVRLFRARIRMYQEPGTAMYVDPVQMILTVLESVMEPYNDLTEVIADNFNVDEFVEGLGHYLQSKAEKQKVLKDQVALRLQGKLLEAVGVSIGRLM